MGAGVVHLVWDGDRQDDPCRRCGRHLQSMNPADGFTLDAAEATCEVRS